MLASPTGDIIFLWVIYSSLEMKKFSDFYNHTYLD